MKGMFFMAVMCILVLTPAASQEIPMMAELDSTETGGSSPGTGTAYLVLSSDRTTLRYYVSVNNLQGTISGAHFHNRDDGSILEPITFTGKYATGNWTIPDSLFELIITDNVYINVHTSAAPGGEIRGRVRPNQHMYPVRLDGAQAGTASTGRGTGVFFAGDSSGFLSLRWRMTYGELTGTRTNAHIHSLPDGTIEYPVTFVDSTSTGEWVNPPDAIVAKLLKGELYVNIHSSTSPGGEIRGTIGFAGEIASTGSLDGAQAGTAAAGKGTAWMAYRPDHTIHYSATVTGLTGPVTGSHFHSNRNGGVVHGVTMTNGHVTGVWNSLTDLDLADFFFGRLYFNVHTTANAGGEIRANFRPQDGGLLGVLDGAQASTTSAAKGTAWLRFDDDSMQYDATYTGLEGTYTAAHLHLSPSSSIIVATPFTNSHAGGWWTPDSLWRELIQGMVYMNIHSSTNPGGEIRANFALGTGIPTSVDPAPQILPSRYILSQNYPNPFNPSTTIDYALPQQGLVTLSISNVLGQLVTKLVDGFKPAGTYTASFDAGRMSSGVYFYSLLVDGKKVATRRMILLK